MESILEIKELSKSFGEITILNKLSLSVKEKEIFGVLGLNGIGKTTLFKCVLGLLNHTAGEVFYKDKPLVQKTIHAKIGYLPEFYLPPGELTGKEYLKLLSMAVSGKRPDIDSLLNKTGLDSAKLIKEYSRGMIQRLGLAIALIKSPEFIILDEPTLGLDPLSRQNLLEWLKELNKEEKTIMLSSHDFSQIEKVCHRVAVLHDQKIRFCGTITEIKEKHRTQTLEDAFLAEIGAQNA